MARVLACLVGVSTFSQDSSLPDIPHAKRNLDAVEAALRLTVGDDIEICRIENPEYPQQITVPLSEMLAETEELFVFYYVGHGLLTAESPQRLFLSCTRSSLAHAEHTAAPHTLIGTTMRESGVKATIQVLDCCFSGRAISMSSTDDERLTRETLQPAAKGSALLASSGRSMTSLAIEGEPLTVYTGALVDVLESGIPGKGERVSPQILHSAVKARLLAKKRPEPRFCAVDDLGDLPLFRNRAASSSPTPAPTTLSAPPAAGDNWETQRYLITSIEDIDEPAVLRHAQDRPDLRGLTLQTLLFRLGLSSNAANEPNVFLRLPGVLVFHRQPQNIVFGCVTKIVAADGLTSSRIGPVADQYRAALAVIAEFHERFYEAIPDLGLRGLVSRTVRELVSNAYRHRRYDIGSVTVRLGEQFRIRNPLAPNRPNDQKLGSFTAGTYHRPGGTHTELLAYLEKFGVGEGVGTGFDTIKEFRGAFPDCLESAIEEDWFEVRIDMAKAVRVAQQNLARGYPSRRPPVPTIIEPVAPESVADPVEDRHIAPPGPKPAASETLLDMLRTGTPVPVVPTARKTAAASSARDVLPGNVGWTRSSSDMFTEQFATSSTRPRRRLLPRFSVDRDALLTALLAAWALVFVVSLFVLGAGGTIGVVATVTVTVTVIAGVLWVASLFF